MNNDYQPVPVSAARAIGEDFAKDCVVILTFDHASNKTHATTWGRSASDKEGAVQVRDKCLVSIGVDMSDGITHQDYRFTEQGKRAQIVDALVASCRELVQAMKDYEMDVDTDPPHKHREMMRRAQDAIANA